MRLLRRRILTLGITLIAVEIFYLMAANAFLRTGLFDRVLNGNPDEISVKLHAAYSLFPGWVHVARIQVRGQDSNVQWLVETDNARLRISLSDLILHRSFHVSRLEAEAGEFQIRARTLDPASTPNDLRELPPIPGFGPQTLLKSQADAEKQVSDLKDSKQPKNDSGLKQIRIENIHIPSFRQIWIGGYRFDGKINLTGSFTVDLGQKLVIPHGRLEILSGNVTRLDRSVLQSLSGVIDANIRDFRIQQSHGMDIFKTVGAKITLQGRLDSLDPLSFMLKSQDWFRLQQTQGAFSVEASVRDGTVDAVPVAVLVAEPLRASFSHFVVDGGARVEFKADRAGHGNLAFVVSKYVISGEKDRDPIIAGKSLELDLESPDLELAHFFRRVTAKVSFPDAKIVDFAFLNRWIPPAGSVTVRQGSGQVSANFEVSNDAAIGLPPGWISVNIDRVRIRKGKHDLIGQIRSRARIEQVMHPSNAKELRLAGSEVHVSGSLLDGTHAWKTDVTVTEGFIRPDDDSQIWAKVKVHMPNVSPFLGEFGVQSGVAKLAQNLLESGEFDGSTELRLSNRRIDMEQITLTSARSQVFGYLRLRGRAREAAVLIHCWPLSVGVELDNQVTRVHLLGADQWYQGMTSGEKRTTSAR